MEHNFREENNIIFKMENIQAVFLAEILNNECFIKHAFKLKNKFNSQVKTL